MIQALKSRAHTAVAWEIMLGALVMCQQSLRVMLFHVLSTLTTSLVLDFTGA